MPRQRTPAYKRDFRKGGFDFEHGNHRAEFTSRSAPATDDDESDQQIKLFDTLRRNEPRQPLRSRQVKRKSGLVDTVFEPAYDTPEYEAYLSHPFYLFTRVRHFPNGGHRHGAVAIRLKREGVRAGALDLYLDLPARGYHGLRIEMKAQKGDTSDLQREERRWLERNGYCVHVCWHFAEALAVLLWYCDIPKERVEGYPRRSDVVLPAKGGHDTRCGCALRIAWARTTDGRASSTPKPRPSRMSR